jgi:hypothetical protein
MKLGPCRFHRHGPNSKKFLRRFFQKAATFFSSQAARVRRLMKAERWWRRISAFALVLVVM